MWRKYPSYSPPTWSIEPQDGIHILCSCGAEFHDVGGLVTADMNLAELFLQLHATCSMLPHRKEEES